MATEVTRKALDVSPARLKIINLRPECNNRLSFGLERFGGLSPKSQTIMKMFINLFGDNGSKEPVITAVPNSDRIRTHGEYPADMIEFHNNNMHTSVSVYVDRRGMMTYGILHNGDDVRNRGSKRDRVLSRGDRVSDGVLLNKALYAFSKSIGLKSVSIDGPREEEPFVVVTRNESEPIAEYEWGDILGFIFVPTKNKFSTGVVQLLARKKNLS